LVEYVSLVNFFDLDRGFYNENYRNWQRLCRFSKRNLHGGGRQKIVQARP
jgi:hypothetical protein